MNYFREWLMGCVSHRVHRDFELFSFSGLSVLCGKEAVYTLVSPLPSIVAAQGISIQAVGVDERSFAG
jgi:hypothetical protein